MNSLDFLYISLAVGAVVLVIAVTSLIVTLISTLRLLQRVLGDIADTTRDVNLVRNSIKLGGLTVASKLLGIIRGRG